MNRFFCSSVPYCIMPGPTQANPMKEVPNGGALARAISSFNMACSIRPPSLPPNSFGQENPTQPFSLTFSSQDFRKFLSRSFFGGRFSARKDFTSSLKFCSDSVYSKSIRGLLGLRVCRGDNLNHHTSV